MAVNPAFAFFAEKVGDYGDITVMAVDGNYDAVQPGGVNNSEPREIVAKEFYKTHPDDYDFLFVFTNFDFRMPDQETVAFYMDVRNDVAGIGIEQFDNSWFFGSEGKLQGVIDMGNLASLSSDPMDPNFSFTLGTMSHELMHRWAAYPRVKRSAGGITYDLLGKDNAHWSFLLDTKGSLMYGNPWQDNGDGTFTSMRGRKYYCPLDLYLMGLIDKSEVPPMLLIDSPQTDKTQVSKPGVTISGAAQNVTIDDITAAEGERFPDASMSQKHFRMGCILAVRPGTFKAEDIPALRAIMNNWVIWHSGLTNGKSTAVFQENQLEALPSNPGPGTLPHHPRQTPAEVEEAVAWLIQKQKADGSWSDSPNTSEKDTAAALLALEPFAQAEAGVENALQWIEQLETPLGTDFLARIIESLVIAGEPVTDYLAQLSARQNADGAWGPDRGYLSSPTDTALALRALMAAGQLDAALLPEAVEYLRLNQNPDGGWGGGPQSSDIQTTAHVLIAFAPLRVPYELNTVVQAGMYWLFGQQHPDGGFGEGTSTVYDTAAALAALKIYDASSQYFGPAIEYLQSMQSTDGSWHASVFETAVAAEALYAWKDAVDPDLAVLSSDILFSPATIGQMPETVTVNAIVYNKGLTAADTFDVRLYENTISDSTVLGQQNIDLAGQSSTNVQFVVSFNDTQDHRLFIVADPGNAVIETNETNNTALAILSNDLNTQPDLQVYTDDIFFSPAVISQMPVSITFESVVYNTGLSDVPLATVALYQDAVSESTKVGEQQVAVAAQSSASLLFSFTVADGDTHRYYLIADADHQVEERNEYNNTALKLLTSNPAYDFGIRDQDITLSTATAEMGEPVTISAHIRNYGNRDGFNIPVRFYIEKEGLEYDIATLTFDLPAGGQIDQQVTWTADRAGTDMRVVVRLDPFGAFSEVSEANNMASALLTVNPYPDPNLVLTHQDLTITPEPALEGQSVTVTARVANNGGGPANGIRVDCTWNREGEPPAALDSRTIDALSPGQGSDVTWTIDTIAAVDRHRVTVTIDPQNAVPEISEDDNSAFKPFEVLSLPDLLIQSSSIAFDPPAPAEGEPVVITVTVQNTGAQEARNVPVMIYEGSQQIAEGVMAAVPGNSHAAITFNYATAGKSGVHYLNVAVDPNHTLHEKRTDNNSAGRTLAVQNGDLWLSQSYFSADGGDASGTTLFFRLDEATDVVVVVINEAGDVVRTFDGQELTQTTGASITWDGRDQRGALVPDGDYQIQVRDLLGNTLLAMPVTVDNNLSILPDAVGTEFLSVKNISCMLPQIADGWQWFADESGLVFMIDAKDDDAPEYPPGVYSMSPDGSNIRLIVPQTWTESRDPDFDYRFEAMALSPDDQSVAVMVTKDNRYTRGVIDELWTMDRYGNHRTLIESRVFRDDEGTYLGNAILGYKGIRWSDDGARLVYAVSEEDNERLVIAAADGTQRLPLASEDSVYEINWAPGGQRLFYMAYDWDNRREAYVSADISGQSQVVYQLPVNAYSAFAQWIDATHFIFTHDDDQQDKDVMVVVDAENGQVLDNFRNLAGGDFIDDLTAHPTGEGFVFVVRPYYFSKGGDVLVRYCDLGGACETLYQRSKYGYVYGIQGMNWSPRGDKLAYVDFYYEKTGENEFAGHLVVMDWPSRQSRTYPVLYPMVPDNDLPNSFHVYLPQSGLWMEQGVLHFGSTLETKTLGLPELTADDQGRAVLRIVQSGTEAATVDAVALKAGVDTFVPSRAATIPAGGDILSMVQVADGQAADVAAATVEYEWLNLPPQTWFTLELRANEFNGAGSDTGGAEPDPGDSSPYPPMDFNGGRMHWFNDGRWLVSYSSGGGTLAIDSKTGEKRFFGVEWDGPELSPRSRYLTDELSVETNSPCYGRGYMDLWALKSLMNLTAELKVVSKDSYLEIRGTAADRNFQEYVLEYATADAPDQWNPIRPPVETMMIDGTMAQWVPPHSGVYMVRLTAMDKAGHAATASRRIAWDLDSPISDLYLDDDYVSPNGDGIKDAVQLHYTVNEPVNLEFYIYNLQTNQRVATLLRSFSTVPPGNGEAVLVWNGRDDTGLTVPDGAYFIEVLGHTYGFVIDNTPPDVTFELTRIECAGEKPEETPKAILRGAVFDENFEQWRIEAGEGDSPQLWQLLKTGIRTFGSVTEDGKLEPEAIEGLGLARLNALTGHKFRITVEDKAGNRATAVTERLEELLALFSWKELDVSAQGVGGLTSELGWLVLPVKRLEDGSFALPSPNGLPKTNLDTDRHRLQAVNTIRTPLETLTLQYRVGFEWRNGPQIQDPDGDDAIYEFLGAIPGLDAVNGLRLMALDQNAKQYFSNIISTSEFFHMSCVNRSGMTCIETIEVYPFEELAYLGLFSGTKSNNTAVIDWDNKDGKVVPRGRMDLPVNCSDVLGGKKFWIYAVSVSGKEYGGPANAETLELCPDPPIPGILKENTRLIVTYPRPIACNSPSSRLIHVDAVWEDMAGKELTKLAYYIQMPDHSVRLLRELDLTTEPWGGFDFDPDALDGNGLLAYPEGTYRLWAVVHWVEADDAGHSHAFEYGIERMKESDETGDPENETRITGRLIVDRTPPQGAVLEPSPDGEICPTITGGRRVVVLKGPADDGIKLAWYAVQFGYGHDVEDDAWIPALNKDKDPLKKFGPPDDGELGEWDVTDVLDGKVTLRLSLVDSAGNVYCKKYFLNINNGHQLSAIPDKKLFSPNADGEADEVNISYTVDNAVTISASVIRDTNVVKTIASGFSIPAGTDELTWGGTDDSHQTVADGTYQIRVTSRDGCGNERIVDIDGIEVDHTPPAVDIVYPQPADPLGILVEIRGSVTDPHFAGYRLEIFEENHPDEPQVLKESAAQVADGLLGRWNTFGADGVRILKLAAWDTVGNQIEKQVRIDLGNRSNLIKDLSVASDVFSPNGDGKLDSAEVKYILNADLNESFDLTLEILADDQHVVNAFTQDNFSAGTGSFVWNGRDGNGQPVADGIYQAVLKVSLTAYPSVVHEEKISIILDTTAPQIDLTEPVNQAFIPAALTIRGTLNDLNLENYDLSLTRADGGSVVALSGQNNRDAYTFASLDDLADGAYSLDVQALDRGQIETRVALSVVVDKTAPKATLEILSPAAVYSGSQPVVEIRGSIEEENIAQWQLRYRNADGAPDDWTVLAQGDSLAAGPITHTWAVGPDDGPADGNYILALYVLDQAGWETQATANVAVDNTDPLATISEPSDNGFVKAPMAITGTAADAHLAGYTLAAAPGECGQAFKWSPIRQASESVTDGVLTQWQALPPDGRYCLRLTAEDAAQNSSQAMVQVTVDTQPPAAPELSGRIENLSQVRLTWTAVADTDLAGYSVYRDGVKLNAAVTTDTEFVDTDLGAGTYHYFVRAVDLAGWESNASNVVVLEVDLTAPEAHIGAPANGTVVAGLVTVRGTAFSDEDFKAYRLYAGQGSAPADWQLIRQSAVPASYGELGQWNTLALVGGETYTLRLEAEDLAGNMGEHRVLVTVDNDPPAQPVLLSATVQNPPGNAVDVLWQANSEPDLAGYLLYRNGQLVNAGGAAIDDPAPYLIQTTAYADTDLADGTHDYVLVAMDAAGNQSLPSNPLSAAVETRAPQAVIVDPEEGYRFDQSFMIRAVCPDRDLATVQFQYRAAGGAQWIDLGAPLTGAPYITYLNPADLSLTYGQYDLRAVAADQSGNVDSAPAQITVAYADITPPAAPAGLQVQVTGGQVSLTWDANAEPDIAGYNVYEVLADDLVKVNDALVTQTAFVAGQPDELDDKLYSFQVVAVDTSDNPSLGSESVQALVYTPWMEQPETPTTSLTAALFGQTVAERNVTLYNDTGSGPQSVAAATADDQGNFGFDADLIPGENRFSVIADDGAGNTSKPSEPIVVASSQPPAAPTGLSGNAEDHDVTLVWDPNTESNLAGYNLYRDGLKKNPDVLVTGGTASASTNTWRAGYVRDGNYASYWYGYTYPGNPPIWWQLDLGAQTLLRRLSLRWNSSSQAAAKFEIQVWTGYSWLPIIRVIGNTNIETVFDLDPLYATDRIRVVIPGDGAQDGSGYVYLSECRLWRADPIVDTTYIDAGVADGTHDYFLEAVNTLGMVSEPSETIAVDVGDVIAPDAPANLIATADGSGVNLSWTPPQAPDLAGYHVYKLQDQQWRRLNEGLITAAVFSDAGLANGTYTYRVTALDTVGNESDPSDAASATVAQALPDQPVNVTAGAQAQGGSIQVCWEAAAGAAGYRLYRATTAGGPYTRVTDALIVGTCYLDTGLTDGTAYYYVVHAVDALGNESADSSEVNAVPSDLTAPSAPLLYAPTTAAVPLSVDFAQTDVLGWAEPGSQVTLFKDGLVYDTTSADATDSLASLELGMEPRYGFDAWALSPDGRLAAFAFWDDEDGHYVCMILDLEQDSRTPIIGDIANPVWSPDSTKLAYAMDTSGGSRIMIYDTRTQTAEQLTGDPGNFDEYTPSWSPDGQSLLYIGTQYNGSAYLCIHDLASGQVEPLVAVGDGRYPISSPDSRYVAYTVGAYLQSMLYVYDRQTGGNPQILNTNLWRDSRGRFCVAWSPDGRYLSYVADTGGSTDIHAWTPSDGGTVPLTLDGDAHHFAWMPDAGHIALVRAVEPDPELWMVAPDSQGQRQAGDLTAAADLYGLKATADGRLGYLADQSLQLFDPAGDFRFSAVALTPGEEVFTATATDPAGNVSDLSQSIVINVDAALLPDLTVKAEEIYTYPYAPIQGEPVIIAMVVRNDGFADARDVRVQCTLWGADDSIELIHDGAIDLLAAGQSTTVQFQWDTSGRAGRWTLIVDVDPDDTVFESYESNNMTLHDFYVATGEGIEMQTLIPYDLYTANQDVPIDVELYNGGRAQDVTLIVNIVDADLQPVALVGEQTFELPYAPRTVRFFAWNTDRTPAGDYYVHSVLNDGSGQLAENLVPFSIDAQTDVETGLVTDRRHYGADQTVQIHGTVANRSVNQMLSDLGVSIVVLDGADQVVHQHDMTLDYLLGGTSAAVNTSWNTALNAPGTYNVVLTVKDGPVEVGRTECVFDIDAQQTVTGNLSVQPALISAGTLVSAQYNVTHSGNSPAVGLPLTLVVLDPDTRTEMDSDTTYIDLGIGDSFSGAAVFDTRDYAAKTYPVQLRSDQNLLAAGVLTVQAPAQLPIEISGSLTADPASVETGQSLILLYTVTNESAVDVQQLELQVTVPEGAGSAFQRQVTLPAGATLSGQFTLSTGQLIPDSYTSKLTGRLTGTVGAVELAAADYAVVAPEPRIHPPVAIAGGPYIAAVGETIQVDGSASFDLDEGLSDSGLEPFDGIMAFEWESQMVEPYDFDDAQGALAELPGYDAPDSYTIALRVTDNTAAAFPSEGWPDLVGTGFDTVDVYVREFTDLSARPKDTKCQLNWSHIGASEYEILRSESGPNAGFETIGTTDTTYCVYTDLNIVLNKDYWYRVRCVIGDETRISVAVHVVSTGRIRR